MVRTRQHYDHASWGDNPANETLCSAETRKLSSATFAWSGPIPSDGVVYLEVEDGSGLSERKVTPVARVLRVLHYYPDRASQAYADFDRQTWTARLGMASEKRAEAHIGAVVESLPAMLAVSVQTEGTRPKAVPIPKASFIMVPAVQCQISIMRDAMLLFPGVQNAMPIMWWKFVT